MTHLSTFSLTIKSRWLVTCYSQGTWTSSLSERWTQREALSALVCCHSVGCRAKWLLLLCSSTHFLGTEWVGIKPHSSIYIDMIQFPEVNVSWLHRKDKEWEGLLWKGKLKCELFPCLERIMLVKTWLSLIGNKLTSMWEVTAAWVTSHFRWLGTEVFPRTWDFQCSNQESLIQAGTSWLPYF